jgi:S1-C subfamily serine protease
MLIDVLIVIFIISSLFRGHEIGFVRQSCSTLGFFGGLFFGAWLQQYTVGLAHTDLSRSLIAALTTLGCAIILLTVGEYIGTMVKHKLLNRIRARHANNLDNWLGSALAVVSVLVSVWLIASALVSLPISGLQTPIEKSQIIRELDNLLPDAPNVIASLGRLIDPNGFPQVFIGGEPAPRSNINLPSLGTLQAAVKKDQASVVKIEGQGCGGIVEGSGFVAGNGLVATNAHVVAGISKPFVQDTNGNRSAKVVWFDPNLDFAVLRVNNLAGKSLPLASNLATPGTAAAIIGYPGGGGLTASPAAVLDRFTATGRNIYNQAGTKRDVYELRATVIPGNSGGPIIAKDGSVIGVVFAESTAYQQVGYALTMPQVLHELHEVNSTSSAVSTGSCAD